MSNTRKNQFTGSRMVVANRRTGTFIRLVIVILACMFALYPFIIVVGAAFNPANSLSGQQLIPEKVTLYNFQRLLGERIDKDGRTVDLANNPVEPRPFGTLVTESIVGQTSTGGGVRTPILRWLINSVFVSAVSMVITLTLTTLAAYAFSRFRFYGRRGTLLFTLVIQVFPSVVALTAFYLLLQQIGNIVPWLGLNSLGGLILVYCGGALGGNAFLMKGYFDTIPREIDESAMVDGANNWTTFTRIILPLIRPILAVIGLLSFIGTFNDYLLPRVLLTSTQNYTLAVGLTTFLGNAYATEWGVFAAGALFGTFPIIAVFILLQTQIVGGLSQGAVKG